MKWTILISIGIISILASCNPCRRLQKRCPPVIHDSIIETIKLDTLILVSPAETLYLSLPVEADLSDLIIVNDTPGPKLDLKVIDGIMSIEIICPEDSLKAIITELERREVKTITVPEPYPEKYIPGFYKWCRNVLIILVILLIGYIYLRIKGIAVSGLLRKL